MPNPNLKETDHMVAMSTARAYDLMNVPNATVSVGASLPETVELHTVDVPDVKYRYAVVGGKTVLVEPSTRKVVHVIN